MQAPSSIDPGEIAKFSAMAAEWWNPRGKFAPLHACNPLRIEFIRDAVAAHFRRDPRALRPFEGLSLLDIGCGGGLLCEPMARLGFIVTGVDPSEKNIGTARLHARQSDLTIDYRCSTAEALVEQGLMFDVVLNMEVVEHVAEPQAFLDACAKLVRPDGMTVVATINKTLKALALAKFGAEYVLRWLPRGTHDWSRFIEPRNLQAMLLQNGLRTTKTVGMVFDPLLWTWRLSRDTDVNYLVAAERAA